MAMSLMHGLHRFRGKKDWLYLSQDDMSESPEWPLNLDNILGFYADWVESIPFDIGYTTRSAFGKEKRPNRVVKN